MFRTQSPRHAGTSDMAPTDLARRIHGVRLPLVRLPENLIRLSQRKFADPIPWSQLGIHRFDSPGARYGVLYTSNRVETAVLEVFGDQWIKDRQVSLNDLKSYDVCEIEVRTSFQVVDATGKQLNRLGWCTKSVAGIAALRSKRATGKARRGSISELIRDRGATQPPAHFHRNPTGCASFGPLLCRSSVEDHSGYSPSALRASCQNTRQRRYTRHGLGALDANFFATTEYAITQEWANALMTHPRAPIGIRYNSRKNPRRINYALFGSPAAKSAVRLVKRYPLLDYGRLFRFLFQYDVEVL
jgi:RES domain